VINLTFHLRKIIADRVPRISSHSFYLREKTSLQLSAMLRGEIERKKKSSKG